MTLERCFLALTILFMLNITHGFTFMLAEMGVLRLPNHLFLVNTVMARK